MILVSQMGRDLRLHTQHLKPGPPRGTYAWKIAVGWQGAGVEGAHFLTGFPELEEGLEVEGGPEGPFWPPVG